MKKIHILGLALCAVFAFSAIAAASAFAADEWLAGGAAITTELETSTEGTLNLHVLSGETEVNEINCSALLTGDVGPKEINLVLDLFNLSSVLIEELPGTALACETLTNPIGAGCTIGGETLLWADELRLGAEPLTWESLLELMAAEPLFLVHLHHVAFELLCFNLMGTNLEFLCEGLTSAAVDNLAAGVEFLFNTAAPISSELLTCTGTVEGLTVGLLGNIPSKLTNGAVLSAS
jgi:hypothetical protein